MSLPHASDPQARTNPPVPLLACPVCYGSLNRTAENAACQGCGRVYPVRDGIPVLIPERAENRGV